MSDSISAPASPVSFRGRPLQSVKRFVHGTHRSVAPEQTLQRIRPLYRRAGLTRLADITGLDRIGIPVVVAVRPNAASIVCSAGKGFTRAAAEVSAAMEAIEIFHGETACPPGFVDSYEGAARRAAVVPVDRLSLLRPSLFDVARPERWALGWDLMHDEEVALPLVQVRVHGFDYDPIEHRSFVPFGSNGLASGNDLPEAICAGLYELIERDALTCTMIAARRGASPFRRVVLETAGPLVRDLCARLQSANFELVLIDRTVDTAVPVVHAVIFDRSRHGAGVAAGYGAHLDPEIAQVRAITEAVQSRAVLIAGARDDIFRHRRQELRRLEEAASIAALIERLPVTTADTGSRAADTFEADIAALLGRLRAIGCDRTVVFELTEPDAPISVVRVIVPGLEGYMSEYYTPGARAHAWQPRCEAAP